MPPVAVSVVFEPLQMPLTGEVTFTATFPMLTATVLVCEQPFLTPVTVYVMLDDGSAVTLAPVVVFKPVDGAQEYVMAPEALSEAAVPLHTETVGLATAMVKPALTVTGITLVELHPAP